MTDTSPDIEAIVRDEVRQALRFVGNELGETYISDAQTTGEYAVAATMREAGWRLIWWLDSQQKT